MTKANTYKYLHWVSLSNLINWSVGYLLETEFGYNNRYPLVPLSVFLSRNKTGIDIQDHLLYTRVTIRTLGMGITVRDKLYGEKIGTKKQFVIHSGQFLVSKIDARNGAFGVVPDEADGAVITGNFWTFDVDTSKINPTYLTLLTSTKQFVLFAEKASNGTTNRHYLQENLFLDARIPLPSLEEQNAIVAAYENSISLAEQYEHIVEKKKEDIENYILSRLEIKPHVSLKTKSQYLTFVHSKDIKEWGYDKITGSNKNVLLSNTFENKPLIDLVFINPPNKTSLLPKDTPISFIPMECISDIDGEWQERRYCPIQNSKGYTKFIDGDLLWAKITPCMQNGKSAIVRGLEHGLGCGSTEFHVLRGHDKNLKIEYLYILLRLSVVLQDAKKSFVGSAGQQRVPKSYLENFSIPVPPVKVQNEIVSHIFKLKEQIKSLRALAATTRTAAIKQFEQTIFE